MIWSLVEETISLQPAWSDLQGEDENFYKCDRQKNGEITSDCNDDPANADDKLKEFAKKVLQLHTSTISQYATGLNKKGLLCQ